MSEHSRKPSRGSFRQCIPECFQVGKRRKTQPGGDGNGNVDDDDDLPPFVPSTPAPPVQIGRLPHSQEGVALQPLNRHHSISTIGSNDWHSGPSSPPIVSPVGTVRQPSRPLNARVNNFGGSPHQEKRPPRRTPPSHPRADSRAHKPHSPKLTAVRPPSQGTQDRVRPPSELFLGSTSGPQIWRPEIRDDSSDDGLNPYHGHVQEDHVPKTYYS
ncbi:hypothetical protein JCM3765_007456 [Sporobolomyces pararoseus]